MPSSTVYEFTPYRLVPAQRRLVRDGTPVKLGGRAFDVLVALVERRERTVSKNELMDLVWPTVVVEENNLEVQIVTLRKLLGYAAIATVPGRGYRFTPPVVVEGVDSHWVPAAEATSAPQPEIQRTNLLNWLPPLYGRDDALASLCDLMQQHACVTVVGPAGVGKTRLAQAAARAWLPAMPGGVWWVDLAPLLEPALLPNAVALAMGLPPNGTRDLMEQLADALSTRATLVVLDNAEHLLDAVADFVGRVRPVAKQLRLLLTSQEVLHAVDEYVYRLDPLSLPEGDAIETVQGSGAAMLFLARAQAADRRFRLTAGNSAVVADICCRLDGIPLAIELAAARISLLGIEGLRARLDQRFEVLTSRDRAVLRRHRTLRDALDWSYRLLSISEQAVFRRLGVFAGGFTIEAAQAVTVDEDGIDSWTALEHLGALVDKSLVVAEGDPTPRYRLLETMRIFALERLIEHDEVDAARTAHRDHYLLVAEAARKQMRSSGLSGLPLLDVERDNLLLALEWIRGDDDGSRGLRLAEAMRDYWNSRGLISRGLQSARAALAHPGIRGTSLSRVRVETHAAFFCGLLGNFDDSLAHSSRAVMLARELGDDACSSLTLAAHGHVHIRRSEHVEAANCAEEALSLARRTNDHGALAYALELMSDVHRLCGRLDLARTIGEEQLELCERSDEIRGRLLANMNLA